MSTALIRQATTETADRCRHRAVVDGRLVCCEGRTDHLGSHHQDAMWWSDLLIEAGTLVEQDASGW